MNRPPTQGEHRFGDPPKRPTFRVNDRVFLTGSRMVEVTDADGFKTFRPVPPTPDEIGTILALSGRWPNRVAKVEYPHAGLLITLVSRLTKFEEGP